MDARTRGDRLAMTADAPRWLRRGVDRMIAVGYGFWYDLVVGGFGPYERLLEEVAALVRRSGSGGPLRVLDVSCGIGNVVERLTRDGHAVLGIDAVGHLIAIAREKARAAGGPALAFHHADIARDRVPGQGTYDVVLSVHTLYWHPDPEGVIAACRRAVRPGGHAIFLTYERPARVARTFREVRAAQGLVAAIRALRWLLPTAAFEVFRDCDHRYLSEPAFAAALTGGGFELLEMRRTFLAELSLLAWVRVP